MARLPKLSLLHCLGLLMLLYACTESEQQPVTPPGNIYTDTTLCHIADLRDARNTSALLPFLAAGEIRHRCAALLAFASVQDTAALGPLAACLRDTLPEIRIAAAHALGQILHIRAVPPLMQAIRAEQNVNVRAALLEALGRNADTTGLRFLCRYQPDDSSDAAGRAWGMYRAVTHGIHSDSSIALAVNMLAAGYTREVRLAAAHTLARGRDIDLTEHRAALLRSALREPSELVRMQSILALGKVQAGLVDSALVAILRNDTDYRCRISAVRAMPAASWSAVHRAVQRALGDSNPNVAIVAADYLYDNTPREHAAALRTLAPQAAIPRVRARLFAAALKLRTDNTDLSNAIQQYADTSAPHALAFYIEALGEDPINYTYLRKHLESPHAVVKNKAFFALSALWQREDAPDYLRAAFPDILRTALFSGDLALTVGALNLLREYPKQLRPLLPDGRVLRQAAEKLELPRDLELYTEYNETLKKLYPGLEPGLPKLSLRRATDWAYARAFPPNPRVRIETSQGAVVLELFVEQAPASALNFLKLAEADYFRGRHFHRVVPNFVIQTGCPRGDGWGAQDYTIPSELGPLSYREGYAGMASSGKDTESCQWFITHSPVPHLDGRYSIFGRVLSGMDVVHRIAVGDSIGAVVVERTGATL